MMRTHTAVFDRHGVTRAYLVAIPQRVQIRLSDRWNRGNIATDAPDAPAAFRTVGLGGILPLTSFSRLLNGLHVS